MNYKSLSFYHLLLIIFLMFLGQFNVLASEQSLIRQQLEVYKYGRMIIGQSDIAAAELIIDFYRSNGYQPVWKKAPMVEILLKAIDDSYHLGLSPNDYHFAEIKQRINRGMNRTDRQRAQLDIILTDALIRLVYHYAYGKVIPEKLDSNWNFSREFITADPIAKLHGSLDSKQHLQQLLDEYNHYGPFYQGLVKALAEYRHIQRAGGWEPIPSGQTIKPGMQDPRIPLIKARLLASGDMITVDLVEGDNDYDTVTEAGVRHFQQRHQLEVDGLIGRGTLKQMNIPVAQRIDQIRANLERIRWIQRNLGDEFVMVNIAGYQVYYVNDNELVWQSRVQVGTDYRKTPVFRDDIKYLVFNPTWTIPPTILAKDVLPALKQDNSYLQKKKMQVIDAKGNTINPKSIDWSAMSVNNFPYMIRQDPGPANALGRVKIMFPNKHMVYLHDTPSKNNFKRVNRAFSSGCIRVENPFELVELLMKDPGKWNQASFAAILHSGQLQNVNLPQTVPVLLLYFTAEMEDNGQVIFYKDVYKRDQKVIQGLKQPFSLNLSDRKMVHNLMKRSN